MAIRRRQVQSIVVLYPKGSYFGGDETDELQKAIMDEATGGNQRLVLNMSECTALNSTHRFRVVLRSLLSAALTAAITSFNSTMPSRSKR